MNGGPFPAESGTFWHYTGVIGMLGIIRSGQLWASSVHSLNDKSELRFGWDVLGRVWADLDKNDLGSAPREHIAGLLERSLSEQVLDSAFVLSTSTEANSECMWTNYAGDRGFCIGINAGPGAYWTPEYATDRIHRGLPPIDGERLHPGWRRIHYADTDQIKLARAVLTWTAANWDGMALAESENPGGALTPEYVLLTSALQLKRPEFRSESEVRFMGGRPDSVPWSTSNGRKYIPIVSTNPAMAAGDKQTWVSMTAIHHSPRALPGDIECVKKALQTAGYLHVKVQIGDGDDH